MNERCATGVTGSRLDPRPFVFDVSVRLIFHSAIVLSLYLLAAGHNQPGGGFIGGLVAGSAVALRWIAGGQQAVRSMSKLPPWSVLGGGLALAGITASIPLLLGEPILVNGAVDLSLPLFGDVKLTSALPFDLGVYAVVVGLALMVFEAFGDSPEQVEAESGTAGGAPADAGGGAPRRPA